MRAIRTLDRSQGESGIKILEPYGLADGRRVDNGGIPMFRRVVLPLLSLVAAFPLPGEDGALDAEFRKVPFDDWFGDRGQAAIKSTVRLSRPRLTCHQRLAA